MGKWWFFMGFNGILMGYLGYIIDLPSGKPTKS
jgi:hypothetical protein